MVNEKKALAKIVKMVENKELDPRHLSKNFRSFFTLRKMVRDNGYSDDILKAIALEFERQRLILNQGGKKHE